MADPVPGGSPGLTNLVPAGTPKATNRLGGPPRAGRDTALREAEISLRATNFSARQLTTVHLTSQRARRLDSRGGGVRGGSRARRPCSPENPLGKRFWCPSKPGRVTPGPEATRVGRQ
jgi:hypothetical protein